jgi:hypothetical protein
MIFLSHPGLGSRRALVLAFFFALAVMLAQTWVAWGSPVRGADLNAYLVGSLLLERGHDPYSFDRAQWRQIADEQGMTSVTGPYRYPIHLAWLLELVGDVDHSRLWLANALLNILAACLGALLTAAALGGGSLYPLALILVGLSGAMGETLLLGQVTGYILLALAGGQLALQRRQPIRFAGFVALGAILKLLPGILILVAAVSRRYRLAAIASITTLVLFILPVFAFGSEHLMRFIGDFREIITLDNFRENNQSLVAVVFRWGLPQSFAAIAKVIAVAAFIGVCFLQWRRPSTAGTQSIFSAGLALALLLPTSSFFLYHLWLLFPTLFVFQCFSSRNQRIAASAVLVAYFVNQILFFLPQLLARAWPALRGAGQDPYAWLGEWPLLFCASLFILACWIGARDALEPGWTKTCAPESGLRTR